MPMAPERRTPTEPTTDEAARAHIDRLQALVRTERVAWSGGQVCWRGLGSGSPVVLVHGGHGSWLHWVRNIEALAAHHTVWAVDLPGFGDSDAPEGEGMAALLAPTLANINPIAHAAEVIPNLTRMESGEAWSLFGNFTAVVGRMAEALDVERRAVAQSFGLALPTLQQHYARSYHVPQGPLHTMASAIVEGGMSPNGPASLQHRYVLEDAPFGLAFLEALGRAAAVRTPVLMVDVPGAAPLTCNATN